MKSKKLLLLISVLLPIVLISAGVIYLNRDRTIEIPGTSKVIELHIPNYLFAFKRCGAAPNCDNPTEEYYSYFPRIFLGQDNFLPEGFEFSYKLKPALNQSEYSSEVNDYRGITQYQDGHIENDEPCLKYEKIDIYNLKSVDHVYGTYGCNPNDYRHYYLDKYLYRDPQTGDVLELIFGDSVDRKNQNVINHILDNLTVI